MKRYLGNAGWKLSNKDELQDKQFYLMSVSYSTSERSTLNHFVLDREETYKVFLKDLDPKAVKSKLESIVSDALEKGVDVFSDFSFDAERVENGYEIILIFNIKGN